MHENRETSRTPAVKPGGRPAGEGKSHTARMYVPEESHRGIVPMNHSNKDGASSAESEEGRLRLKENTLSSDTHPTQSGTACVPRVGECADKRHIGRYSSARRTGCAKERSSGSVRGAPGNRCSYRDRQLSHASGVQAFIKRKTKDRYDHHVTMLRRHFIPEKY